MAKLVYIVVEDCAKKRYGKSCCRSHYYQHLRSLLGPCAKCQKNNRHKSTSDLCVSCYEQTDERRNYHYLEKYGISVYEYKEMFAKQDGLCAICGLPPSGNTAVNGRMCVDHNHRTGKVRKLLCFNCNTAIGKMLDSPALLRKAADYLERENNG